MRTALLALALFAGCATNAGSRLVGEWERVAGDEETELDWFDAGPEERARMRAEWSATPGRERMIFRGGGRFEAAIEGEDFDARYEVFLSEGDTAIVRFDPDFGHESYYVFEVEDGFLFWNRQYVWRRVR
jgi:hypothetical protein